MNIDTATREQLVHLVGFLDKLSRGGSSVEPSDLETASLEDLRALAEKKSSELFKGTLSADLLKGKAFSAPYSASSAPYQRGSSDSAMSSR